MYPAISGRWLWASLLLLSGHLFVVSVQAADTPTEDQSLAPYFYVHSSDPGTDRLPLKATDVEVQITGVIAAVKLTQHYRNEGSRPIEADYVFPGSTRAAVHALTMTLSDRVVVAEIREKTQARAEFAQARAQGKSATLLEQHRPNVFQTRIANILPGDDLQVILEYTELLVPTAATYEFVFPTVVGPRYTNQTAVKTTPGEAWTANPTLHAGADSLTGFNIKLGLHTGIPLQQIVSNTHAIDVNYADASDAEVTLRPTTRATNNRDFCVRYQLAGRQVEAGLLLYEGAQENFFLATVEPPKVVKPEQIPPRDYVFVVDVSGSMHGFPLTTAKTLLGDLIGKLRPGDTFNVLLFSGANKLLAPRSLPANRDNIDAALALIDSEDGAGGTELLPALQDALALPTSDAVSRSIVVVTDGYVNVEGEAFDLVRNNLSHANLFAFGIGSSVNRYLIEGLAKAGQGEPFVVTSEREAKREAQRLRRYIEAPVLTHVHANFTDFEVYDVEPRQLPDLLASRPVVLFGKWRGPKAGRITISGQSGQGPYEKSLEVSATPAHAEYSALNQLWARQRISELTDKERLDEAGKHRVEITRHGLDYHLLTAYTSFIAVDHIVRNTQPQDTAAVRQALPLPAGVSDLAVGEVPTTPEPETWLLMIVATLALWWVSRERTQHA
jgi:Ca-activated chloride channel homolog